MEVEAAHGVEGIDPLRPEDLDLVLEELAADGMVLDRWELEFNLKQFPQGCFLFRKGGVPVGLACSIKYESSGWIANVNVLSRWRGMGIATALTEKALDALVAGGVTSIWLTATDAGTPIYRRLGFKAVDTINRWAGFGVPGRERVRHNGVTPQMLEIDAAGWGDRKESVMSALAERGCVLEEQEGFLTAHEWKGLVRIGPWSCRQWMTAWDLFDAALALAGRANPVLVHAPLRNSAASTLLFMHHFRVIETHLLMCFGDASGYDPSYIFSLAVGSIG